MQTLSEQLTDRAATIYTGCGGVTAHTGLTVTVQKKHQTDVRTVTTQDKRQDLACCAFNQAQSRDWMDPLRIHPPILCIRSAQARRGRSTRALGLHRPNATRLICQCNMFVSGRRAGSNAKVASKVNVAYHNWSDWEEGVRHDEVGVVAQVT